jgi:sigma-B regulation protein RsbU (phosphoserine phosphatase)
VRILVVDDEASGRFLLNSMLTGWGHEVVAVASGGAAWSASNESHFDLIISDWNMPEMDGLALCRLIRQNPQPFYRYVILCTGNSQKSDFIRGMEAGADDFVVKPIDFAELRVRVRAAERILTLQMELAGQNDSLKTLNQQLQGAYQGIRRDLQAAAAMQLRLLPKKIEIHKGISLDWLMIPSSFLAGDMLNYFMVDDRHLVFYLLDVSGHGVPAALLSVTLNRVLLPEPGSPILRASEPGMPPGIASPPEVVSELNRRFQSQDDQYFTIVYGIFDTGTREARFCQAGHPAPLHMSAGGVIRAVGEPGFPVGLWPSMDYQEYSVRLAPGDRLVIYSDGITECRNPDGASYSEANLNKILQKKCSDPAPNLVAAVQDDIRKWHGTSEFTDDVSLLVLECII